MGFKKYYSICQRLFLIIFVIVLCSVCSSDEEFSGGSYQGYGGTQIQFSKEHTGFFIPVSGEKTDFKWECSENRIRISIIDSDEYADLMISGDYLFVLPLNKINGSMESGDISTSTILIDGNNLENSTEYIEFHPDKTFSHYYNGAIRTGSYELCDNVIKISYDDTYAQYIVWDQDTPYFASIENVLKKDETLWKRS
ncbi:MAG: hypothetical protein MR648_10320 [Clostridiales bacterium]|nr:hypothetical protein [Clostridiales bacterium]